MDLPFSLVIPLYTEVAALRFSIFHMKKLGVKPLYILDTKCGAETRNILSAEQTLCYFDNDKPYIENGYRNLAFAAPTDWILRIDCDELPNEALLRIASEYARSGESGSPLGFCRRQLIPKNDELMISAVRPFGRPYPHQFRLFNRSKVVFDQRIHTPGIVLDERKTAPPEAVISHLSWVFLTSQERAEKFARYEAHGQRKADRENVILDLSTGPVEPLCDPFLQASFAEWRRQEAADHLSRLA